MELNFKVLGSGPPLVILHGLFGMLDNWKTIGTQLSEHYSVYLIDIRNHGRSPHVATHSYPEIALDLKVWMEQQGIPKAHFMGHSMGGKAVIQLAHDYPDLVDKLIVVDIVPKQYQGGHEKIIKALSSVPIDTITSRKEAEALLALTIEDPGVILFLMKNLSRNKEGGFQWKMNLPVIADNYEDNIMGGSNLSESVEVPTCFIKGERSNYISANDLQLLNNTFTEYEIISIDNAGHWVHADNPERLLQVVIDTLG